MRSRSVPLSSLRQGQKGTILALRGGRSMQHRVLSMGLSVGSEVEVMQNDGADGVPGPVAVRAGDTRLMVGHGIAENVIVRGT